MVRRLAEGRRRRKNAPPSTCSLPDDQYVHVIYGGMIHDTRMLEYHIIWNVRVRSDFMLPRVDGGYTLYLDQLWGSDFMLPRVDGGHTWINYGIYSVLNLLLENIGERRPRVGQCFLFSPPSSIS